MQALQNKSATVKHDIPLIVRGQDASISTGSVKAAVRRVQDSHTSAVSEATKSYCGLRMKSCPRRCANLESRINRDEYSDWKWTNDSAAYWEVWRYLVTGTAEVKLYTRQCFDRWGRRSAQTLGRWEGRQQRNRTSAHAASLPLSKKHSTPVRVKASEIGKARQRQARGLECMCGLCRNSGCNLVQSAHGL